MAKSDNPDVRELQVQMIDVKDSLVELKREQHSNFVELSKKIDALAEVPITLEDHDKRIKRIENGQFSVWLERLITLIGGGVLAFLIQYAITH